VQPPSVSAARSPGTDPALGPAAAARAPAGQSGLRLCCSATHRPGSRPAAAAPAPGGVGRDRREKGKKS